MVVKDAISIDYNSKTKKNTSSLSTNLAFSFLFGWVAYRHDKEQSHPYCNLS